MPTPRTWGTCAVVNGKIYVIGGYSFSTYTATNVNEVYDPSTDTWETKTPLPQALFGITREDPVIDGKIYVTHGLDGVNFHSSNYMYDPSTDSWEQKSDAAHPRDGAASAVVSGKLYVMGGRAHIPGPYGVDYNEVYDPSLDTGSSWNLDNAQRDPSAKYQGDYGLLIDDTSEASSAYAEHMLSSSNLVVDLDWDLTNALGVAPVQPQGRLVFTNPSSPQDGSLYFYNDRGTPSFKWYDGSFQLLQSGSWNIWYHISIVWAGQNSKVVINGVEYSVSAAQIPTERIMLESSVNEVSQMYFDNIRVRQYSAIEPTLSFAVNQRSLTVASAHDSPNPAVGVHSYADGSSVTASVTSPVTEGNLVWTCTGWTGTGSVPATGSGSTTTFTITADSSITWTWSSAPVPRSLTVASAHDSPNPAVGVHSYADGSSVTASVTSPVTEGNLVWTCTGWTGTGSVPATGSGSTTTFTITADSSITWTWSSAPVPRSLTVASAHDSPTPAVGVHSYADGSSVTASVTSPVTEGNLVWTCTGWTGTGSVPATGSGSTTTFTITADSSITWTWSSVAVPRSLTVASAHDSPTPAVGVHSYADGGSVTASVTSPVTEGNLVWTCTGWTGTGSVPATGSGSTTTFTITADSSITWTWSSVPVPRSLTVASAHDSPNPAVGVHSYADGGSVTASVTSPVTEGSLVWTCTGWTGTGSVPATGSGSTTTFTITADSSITWTWSSVPVPRSLTVASAHDSPNPAVGVHSYADGSSVTASVTSPVTEGNLVWTCTGWTGTGSVPATGSGSTTTFTITADSSITWTWSSAPVPRSLTVASAHDSPNPAVGVHSYADGSSVTASVTSPVTEGNFVWTCTGWTGTGSVPATGSGSTTTFTITADSSITWTWSSAPVPRSLTVASAHDSPNPAVGVHSYADGSSVTASVTSPVTEGNFVWTCTGWTGTGSVPATGSGSTTTFTITADSSITWTWSSVPVPRSLTVASAHDSPNPAVGVHSFADGGSVTASVTSPVTEGNFVWTCTGWTGTGSVPVTGSGSTTTFTITADSSITWTWSSVPVPRSLTVASAHDSPNPAVGVHSFADGGSVTASVTSPVTEGNFVWTCTGWTGTGSVPVTGSGSTATFTISADSSITWTWSSAPVSVHYYCVCWC